MTRLTVPTLVGVSLAALGVALTLGGYEVNAHAAESAKVSSGAVVFAGYLLVIAAALILGISALNRAFADLRAHDHGSASGRDVAPGRDGRSASVK